MRLRLALCMLAFSTPSFAQQDSGSEEPKPERKVIYERNTKVDFDETVIPGTRRQPYEIFSNVRQPGRFDVWIPERSNFKNDLAESIGVILEKQPPSK